MRHDEKSYNQYNLSRHLLVLMNSLTLNKLTRLVRVGTSWLVGKLVFHKINHNITNKTFIIYFHICGYHDIIYQSGAND